MEKFKSQLGASDTASMCSEVSPKNSLAYHRITPISPSYQVGDHKGRGVGTVTTSAIVSHEMDGSKSRRGSRLIYNGASMLPSTVHAAGSATSKSSSTASRYGNFTFGIFKRRMCKSVMTVVEFHSVADEIQ